MNQRRASRAQAGVSGWRQASLFILGDGVLLSILWRDPLQHQQTSQGQRDPNPPQRNLGFTEDQLAQESLQDMDETDSGPVHTKKTHKRIAGSDRELVSLTEEMKLEAVVVTVVQVEEDE